MFDLLREIGQTLRNNKLRTGLTGLAVVWGVFMLIILLGVARGVVNASQSRMESSNTRSITYWGGRTSMAYQGYPKGRQITLKDGDRETLSRENSHVIRTSTSASVPGNISGPKGVVSGAVASFPSKKEERRVSVAEGRFLNHPDMENLRHSIVIHRDDAVRLFGDSVNVVGRTVRLLDLTWTVVGVYASDWGSDSYIPYTTYKALTGNSDEVYELNVYFDDQIKTEDEAQEFDDDMHSTLARQHTVCPADAKAAFYSWNKFTDALRNAEMMRYLNMAVWVLGLLTLLTGIVGVSNIMFVSVRERTHEIGIRRAIGAKPHAILIQILAESVAITALFGYIGIVLGMLLLQVVDMVFGSAEMLKNPTVDIRIAVEVTVALIIAGAAAGLFPALKAIKVKPVEALRDE